MKWMLFENGGPEYGKEVLIYSERKNKYKIAKLVLDRDAASEYWHLIYHEGYNGTASTFDYDYWCELEFSLLLKPIHEMLKELKLQHRALQAKDFLKYFWI